MRDLGYCGVKQAYSSSVLTWFSINVPPWLIHRFLQFFSQGFWPSVPVPAGFPIISCPMLSTQLPKLDLSLSFHFHLASYPASHIWALCLLSDWSLPLLSSILLIDWSMGPAFPKTESLPLTHSPCNAFNTLPRLPEQERQFLSKRCWCPWPNGSETVIDIITDIWLCPILVLHSPGNTSPGRPWRL